MKKHLKKIFASLSLLLAWPSFASDFTVGSSSIIDLRNESGTSQWDIGDDSRSGAINLGFTFNFFGNNYTQGYMSTNGCWSFTTSYCNDYTPDPLPDTPYTIYPFWTDLIRDGGSKMLTKYFSNPSGDDYFVAGWYDLREYHRSSDNTIEMLLYQNSNNIEFRYEDLDIIKHDVLIGIQGDSSEYEQYLFHDECSTGTTNVSGSCVNTDWNNTSFNTTLENNSLLLEIDITAQCSANPLYSENCNGYAVAYFNQQCNINPLYDEDCDGYDQAYLTQQCSLDTLYHSNCIGYEAAIAQQQAIEDSYMIEEYWYDDGMTMDDEYNMYGYPPEDFYFEEDLYDYNIVGVDTFIEDGGAAVEDDFIYEYEYDLIYEEEYIEQLNEEYLFEDLEITDVWLNVEEELQEEEETIEMETISELEEQSEEISEELEELVEENEVLFMEEEALNNISEETGDSFFQRQKEQVTGSQSFKVLAADSSQQQGQQEQDEAVFEEDSTFTQADIQFEQNFNDAIALGGDIGTFLSQQEPNFGRFEVQPPTAIEQRTTQAVESLADQVGEEVAQQNLQIQLDAMVEEGGFGTDQTIAVAFMGYKEGFSQYTNQSQLQDNNSWYRDRILYNQENVQDNNFNFYMLAGNSQKKLNEMVDVEYN